MIDLLREEDAAHVVAALDTLLYAAEDTLEPIVARATDHVESTLADVWEALEPSVQAAMMAADVNLPGEDADTGLDWSPVERLTRELGDQIAQAEQTAQSVVDRAIGSVGGHVADILPGNTDILGALVRAISELIGGFLGSLEETPDLWKALYDVFHGELGPRANPIGKWLSSMLDGVLADAAERGKMPDDITARLVRNTSDAQVPVPGTVEDYIKAVAEQPRFMQAILNTASLFAGIIPILNARIAGYISGVTQTSLAQSLTTPLSPAELAQLVRMDFVGQPWAVAHAGRSGVSPDLFKLKLDLTERLLAPEAVLTYWRYTGDNAVLDILRRAGYTDDAIDKLKRISLAEATPSDVVRFMARDVTDPNAIASGQLDKDFGSKYDKALFDKAGVSQDLAKLYWMAHWSLPSPTQGYEMLHRDELTMPELEKLLEYADYAPAYVQKLINVAYNVPGRIDVRRMWELGVITSRAELEKRYRFMGYSPADAVTIADFTETLANKAKQSELERRTSSAVREIVQSCMVGTVSTVFAEQALLALGLLPARVASLMAGITFGRERDRSDRIRDAIGKAYIRGYSTEDEARAKLAHYGFGDDEITFLTDSWNLDRELADDTEEKRKQRDLSKSEIIDAYEDRITTRDEAQRGLEGAGYDPDEANTLLQLADNKRQRADNQVAERAVHVQYVNRRISEQEATQTLAGFGYLQPRIAALMTRWQVEREEKRPDISAAQLQKMLVMGVVPEDQVEQMLRERGYSERDINLMMTLYASEEQMAVDKLAEQRRQFEIREARLSTHGAARIGLQERSLDIKEGQFNVAQQGLQQRFEAGQELQRDLQQERLDTQTLLQASRLAAQTSRDAAQFAATRERQERQIQAQIDAQERSIAAANARAQSAADARQKALDQQAKLRADANLAADVRQARALNAQADRQLTAIAAAEAAREQAAATASALADQRASLQAELQELRAMLQAARDIQLEADRIEREQRQEAAKVRAESRAFARKEIGAQDAAANAADLQALQLQHGSLVADLESRFAALQAQLAARRAQSALDAKQAAERLLQASTPASTLLGTVGY